MRFNIPPPDQVDRILGANTDLEISRGCIVLVETASIKDGIITTQNGLANQPSWIRMISEYLIGSSKRNRTFVFCSAYKNLRTIKKHIGRWQMHVRAILAWVCQCHV